MGTIDKTPQEYQKLIKKHQPTDSKVKNFFYAYLVGGLICFLGQFIINVLVNNGMPKDDAGSYATIALIFIGALLTGLGVYDEIAQFAGAGTIVPVTGFSNAVVAPAMEYRQDGYILGLGANIYSVAGPVLTYGMLSAFLIGLLKLIF
ncbi:stage V sporulation protein AC [Orenia metallireducens]|jgi:stage V sporulation protein AC|uniref:Stage V sporulation protein AC n=1 Tax=Orenia metallireducens TaxID=1413210 RepID=A0A1C0A9Q5_9FIRM|nr:stage V sporulation protein AC [Orenia metallireducens]OCL27006.1 stage V sporulation protein AC [Orenia metallireducens]